MARQRNEQLAALLEEAGWSRAQAANAFNRLAAEGKIAGSSGISRSHISMWVAGTKPSGAAPAVLAQALARRLKRDVTPEELGFSNPHGASPAAEIDDWNTDPLACLDRLRRWDLGAGRREFLVGAVFSATSLVLPGEQWWRLMAQAPSTATAAQRQHVGNSDVRTIQELTAAFSRMDQQRGGGHGRKAVAQYLHSDVGILLRGKFSSDRVRLDMFSAASELAYLSGWMAFDNAEHAMAQRYFLLALKLAARASDSPLAGHIFRAMAHQSLDLGFPQRALELSTAAMDGQRYASSTPRERALIGVVHARTLAANGRKSVAARALLAAEDDLSSASEGIAEPNRTFFFAEASLAHETACTLRDSGDMAGAVRQFRRSIHTRGAAFRRTHAVTLGYLAATQMSAGNVEDACGIWCDLLDAMEEGIYSGRARQALVDLRSLASSYRRRGIPALTELDGRSSRYLASVE